MRCVLKDRPFNVTSNGAIVIFGTYILEHSIFLKGSNGKEDWSKTQADIDALSEYIYDCKSVGMNATAIQSIETKYKPSMLLDRIASRMKSDIYKNNQALFNSDYEELRRAAADTMDDMLTKILNDYYTMQQESPQSLFEQIVNYLLQKADAIIFSVVTTFIITWLGFNRRKPRLPQTKKKDK
jgi:Fe2+ transport system protein B